MLDMHVALKILRAASNIPIQSERPAQTYEIVTLIRIESDHCLVQMAYTFNSISRKRSYRKRAVMKDVLALGYKKRRQRAA